MKIAGIDEAGRGPVIGPMVMSITKVEEKDLEKLENIIDPDHLRNSESLQRKAFSFDRLSMVYAFFP